MAHFAKLNDYNMVIEVVVVDNETLDPQNEEASGIAFLTEWSGGYTNWKQTSYNGTFRKNFAGKDSFYDALRDAFIMPKPYPSWIFNEDKCIWECSVPFPTDGKAYKWDEDTLSWVELTI